MPPNFTTAITCGTCKSLSTPFLNTASLARALKRPLQWTPSRVRNYVTTTNREWAYEWKRHEWRIFFKLWPDSTYASQQLQLIELLQSMCPKRMGVVTRGFLTFWERFCSTHGSWQQLLHGNKRFSAMQKSSVVIISGSYIYMKKHNKAFCGCYSIKVAHLSVCWQEHSASKRSFHDELPTQVVRWTS